MKIVVKNIYQIFPSNVGTNFEALSNVSLSINQGEIIGIIGPTGAGKTTLIEHFNALLIPTKGEIQYEYVIDRFNKKTQSIEKIERNKIIKNKKFGKIKDVKELRKTIGIVFQFAEYQLFEDTIEKDIIFGPINMGVSKEEAKKIAKEIIVQVGLSEEYLQRSPFELSGGQKRRVALAGILAMKPDVLVFDEPTAGLDPAGAKDMLNLFKEINKLGVTVIIVTHNLDDVLEYTNRTIFLEKSKLIRDENTLLLLSDIDFLKKHNMEPPKLTSIIYDINEKYGTKLDYVKTIDELAAQINSLKKGEK